VEGHSLGMGSGLEMNRNVECGRHSLGAGKKGIVM